MLSDYFKEKSGFHRLFLLLKEKYVSLGRYSGSIQLPCISEEEAQTFTDFFGKQYIAGTDITIRFKDIEKVLRNTRFQNFSWDELFSDYFGSIVKDKKTITLERQQEEEQFFQHILSQLSAGEKKWLENALQDKSIQSILLKRYRKEKLTFGRDLYFIIKLLFQINTLLPTTLAMFSSQTGNPHFLDLQTVNMTLFLKLLSYKLGVEEPKTTLEKISLLNQVGISVDRISNFVITYKLRSESKLVESFYDEQEVLNLNLGNIDKIKDLDTDEKYVFVFENPSLLSELKDLDVPMVVTSGNANLCVLKVLQKLEKSHTIIYYNGDFDPEGLLNAQRLKMIIPTLRFFCYEEEDFECTKSDEKIVESRLHKLRGIELKELELIKQKLLGCHKAGYQEKNIDRIRSYIEKMKAENQ